MTRGEEKSNGNTFFDKVYKVVKKVPYGRVTTYGAIAEYLGTRGSARMVGWAMNASHTDLQNVPAHRVVNRNGVLTGKRHFGGPNVMQQLLESEGIKVINDRIINFEKHLWDPSQRIPRKGAKEPQRRKGKISAP
jgi:methylated-DNA-protein-cysteine methyltransferase related protein